MILQLRLCNAMLCTTSRYTEGMQVPAGNPVLKVRERKTRALGFPPDLVSVKEVAQMFGVHADTVRRQIYLGNLPEYWFAGNRRVSLADVAKLGPSAARRKSPNPKAGQGKGNGKTS